MSGLTYRDAGVDIDAGNRAVSLMKAAVEATHGPEVLAGIGAFGGLFSQIACVWSLGGDTQCSCMRGVSVYACAQMKTTVV